MVCHSDKYCYSIYSLRRKLSLNFNAFFRYTVLKYFGSMHWFFISHYIRKISLVQSLMLNTGESILGPFTLQELRLKLRFTGSMWDVLIFEVVEICARGSCVQRRTGRLRTNCTSYKFCAHFGKNYHNFYLQVTIIEKRWYLSFQLIQIHKRIKISL